MKCKISEYLQKRQLTQRELADAIGSTEVSISRYVNGERIPKATTCIQIAKALDCKVEDLYCKTENMTSFDEKKDNRWIPCSERLPEAAGREVLATLENKYGQRRCAIVFQGYGDNRWHCNHKEYNLDYWKATAWQPVPEPYKED